MYATLKVEKMENKQQEVDIHQEFHEAAGYHHDPLRLVASLTAFSPKFDSVKSTNALVVIVPL